MKIECIILGILFVMAGFLLAFKKGYEYLSVWKNMQEEEKKKIKIKELSQNIGEVIMLNGIIFLINGVWTGFSKHWFSIAMIAWFIVAVLDVFYIHKSKRYNN